MKLILAALLVIGSALAQEGEDDDLEPVPPPASTLKIKDLHEKVKKRQLSVEKYFNAARPAANDLFDYFDRHRTGYDEQRSITADLIPGFKIWLGESSGTEPDKEFFKKLAFEFGDKADKDYFEMYFKIRDEYGWTIYFHQETDITGCTAWGTGEIVTYYKETANFRKKHPNRYVSHVPADGPVHENVDLDTERSCSGNRSDIVKELKQLIKDMPKSPEAAIAKKILAKPSKKTDATDGCKPGKLCIAK